MGILLRNYDDYPKLKRNETMIDLIENLKCECSLFGFKNQFSDFFGDISKDSLLQLAENLLDQGAIDLAIYPMMNLGSYQPIFERIGQKFDSKNLVTALNACKNRYSQKVTDFLMQLYQTKQDTFEAMCRDDDTKKLLKSLISGLITSKLKANTDCDFIFKLVLSLYQERDQSTAIDAIHTILNESVSDPDLGGFLIDSFDITEQNELAFYSQGQCLYLLPLMNPTYKVNFQSELKASVSASGFVYFQGTSRALCPKPGFEQQFELMASYYFKKMDCKIESWNSSQRLDVLPILRENDQPARVVCGLDHLVIVTNKQQIWQYDFNGRKVNHCRIFLYFKLSKLNLPFSAETAHKVVQVSPFDGFNIALIHRGEEADLLVWGRNDHILAESLLGFHDEVITNPTIIPLATILDHSVSFC
ncbi:hypothetical protein Ciccas_013410 [Cichlidogyrus casuarinus]|uniref:Uncharacterized protein n=1 Tax=Cichlidogyrus casuarinus TaxID=1844966 RepID=A0ABD2PKN1_9PLAT